MAVSEPPDNSRVTDPASASTLLTSVAIFGGTFDPVHRGHIETAKELKQALNLDEVYMLPCHLPAHRDVPGASAEQRLEMLELAILGTDLQIDDRELRRERISYSIETLEAIREQRGDHVALIWVMGSDAFCSFNRWHRWQDLLALAHILVVRRPGQALPESGELARFLASHQADSVVQLKQQPSGLIAVQGFTAYDVAATDIRDAIGNAAGNARLGADDLAPAVRDYIDRHGLYLQSKHTRDKS